MQPLLAVDHESRLNSSYRAEEARPSEETPLLHRFPQTEVQEPRSASSTVVISLLLIILISGVVIGIYLLIVQNNSENILPPVESPLHLVSASQWDPQHKTRRPGSTAQSPSQAQVSEVIVTQTDSEPCHSTKSCEVLLRQLQTNSTDGLPYNFLISPNGQTFESLGWRQPSPLFPGHNALVIAFIGNYTVVPPTRAQVDEAKSLFAESVSLRCLSPSFSIIGKNMQHIPKHLFKTLSTLPQWNSTFTDTH